MKTKLIFAGMLAVTGIAKAQWNFVPNIATTTNSVGIGSVTTPAAQLHIATNGATQFFAERTTFGQANGVKLFFTSNPATGITAGAGSAIFQNQATVSDMLFMPTPTSAGLIIKSGGNVGIGLTTPVEKLSVTTTVANDGISVTQTNTQASALHLYNTTTGGNHWALFSAGNGNSQGSGNFSIYQYNATDRLFINGTTGNVGIGSITPSARVDVVNNANPSSVGSQWGVRSTITQITPVVQGGSYLPFIGVEGDASTNSVSQSLMYGVTGNAKDGLWNWGGKFTATHATTCANGEQVVGVEADATGGQYAYGILASASGGCTSSYAGYFNGNVLCTGAYLSSDRKLKKDIQPLTSTLDKIMKLKPSTYTYRTGEFGGLNLPGGPQIGLIAQELEEVFPELITLIPAISKADDKGNKVEFTPEFKAVQYINLIPVLINGMQEQQKQIEAQQQTIDALMNKQSVATGIDPLSNVLNGFSMDQNVPNPFSNETVINYNLPQQTGAAALIVYDLTGKQITSFPLNQKGAASISITSEKLQAGIYIYSIVADGKVMGSKRMIVAEK